MRLKRLGWLAVVVGCGVVGAMLINEKVSAASTAEFEAGYIMSDYQMRNYSSMSEAQIQNFLTSKNSCGNRDYNYYLRLSANSGYKWHFANGHFVCLSEEKFGDGETIGYGESAAHIIWQAAQDYRINPQVLIAMLQKETGLVTDPIPNNGDYRKAMGYGCPDSAACSSRYYGFKNQVRNAAALLKSVMDGGWSNYPVGNNYIAYSPNAACGGSVVNIRNRATSALYRYTPYQPNAGALAAGYGTAYCGSYGNRNFYLYFQDWFGNPKDEGRLSLQEILTHNRVSGVGSDLELSYQAHVADYGWLPWTGNGEMAGTAGYSLRMEALALKLKNETGIEYRAHVQDVGWMNYVRDGAVAGTTGQSRRIEAVQIRLTGDMAKLYDVYYRVHVEGYGWMGWVKNDQVAGTTGQSRRVEAIQVYLAKKQTNMGPSYMAHVQDVGWMNWVNGGAVAGTTGRSKRMEAIKIKLPSGVSGGDISYRVYAQDIGWTERVKNGAVAGTTGRGLRAEALQIKLTGDLVDKYDVYYRVHVEDYGWMKWVKNDAVAGVMGQSKRIEAVQVELVKKTQAFKLTKRL